MVIQGFCSKGGKSWQSSQVNQVSSMQTRSNEVASQFASPRQFSAPRLCCQELMAFLNAQATIGNFQPDNSSTAANLVNQVYTEGYNPFLDMSDIPKI